MFFKFSAHLQSMRRLMLRVLMLSAVVLGSLAITQFLYGRYAADPAKIADFVQAAYVMGAQRGQQVDLERTINLSCAQQGAVPNCKELVQKILAERNRSRSTAQLD